MDSDCSKYMNGKIENFLLLKAHEGGSVSFGEGNKGYIVGIIKVRNNLSHTIDDVHNVNRLKFSLLSVA